MDELINNLTVGKWGILAAVLAIACWGAYHEHRMQKWEARQRRQKAASKAKNRKRRK